MTHLMLKTTLYSHSAQQWIAPHLHHSAQQWITPHLHHSAQQWITPHLQHSAHQWIMRTLMSITLSEEITQLYAGGETNSPITVHLMSLRAPPAEGVLG